MPATTDACAVAFLDTLSRFTFERHGEGALHLVAGGLLVMGCFTLALLLFARRGGPDKAARPLSVLTAVRSLPRDEPEPRRYADDALADPIGAWEKGRVAGRKVRARVLDDVMDRMFAGGIGEPRIIHSAANVKIVRVHACRGCGGKARAPKAACHFERGFLEGAFGRMVEHEAHVRETRCRAVGDPWCEFEVKYG